MPRSLILAALVIVSLALVPIVLIARARVTRSEQPRLLIIPDMASQPKLGPQAPNPLFADGRAMRPRVTGVVARFDLEENEHLSRGNIGEEWADVFPVRLTGELMRRGRRNYDVFCSPCHGLVGNGNGMVSKRAEELETSGWVPPVSFHTDLIRGRPVGHLFNTVTNGIRSMPSYGEQIQIEDRWAIVAYLRALQRSRNATMDDVPSDVRLTLE